MCCNQTTQCFHVVRLVVVSSTIQLINSPTFVSGQSNKTSITWTNTTWSPEVLILANSLLKSCFCCCCSKSYLIICGLLSLIPFQIRKCWIKVVCVTNLFLIVWVSERDCSYLKCEWLDWLTARIESGLSD